MMDWQSVLAPAGPIAGRVVHLWWFAFTVAAVVYVATIGTLVWALRRAHARARAGAALPADDEQRMTRSVTWALAATIVILLVFFMYDLSVGRTISGSPSRQPLTIEITGRQWWWEVQYADTSVHDRFTTANEVHIPVGEPVLFVLTAADVIHSIWVPNLAGKKDLIPGYTQSWWFQADTAGVYRGQCAEFCGLQHAKMALYVVAEPRAQFDRWVQQQRQPAAEPTDSIAAHGRTVFLGSSCTMCHSIAGTPAGSQVGPDLTHIASRHTLAAGSLVNTRANLRSWILDAQAIKPGANMPQNSFAPQDLEALLTYLASLK